MSALPYLAHGTTLALAWFFLFNLAATAAVVLVSSRLTPRAASPGFWLALRLAPAALSIGFVALVFLPSYWRYEPRELVEGFDVTLTALAALGLAADRRRRRPRRGGVAPRGAPDGALAARGTPARAARLDAAGVCDRRRGAGDGAGRGSSGPAC